jgi:DNA-binding GntR family transcriptional regulator
MTRAATHSAGRARKPPAFSRVVRRNLADHAYEQLHRAITSGGFVPGQRLGDATLAAQLNISRAPVREAIARLESSGLAVGQAGRGWSVVEFSDEDIEEIYTLRATIEAFAAERAATRITPAELENLDALVAAKQSFGDRSLSKDVSKIDLQFHEAIVRAAHHERVYRTWRQLLDQVTIVAQMTMRVLYYDDLREARLLHDPILDAIRARDPEAAAREARRHALGVYELFVQQRHGKAPPGP